MCSIASELRLRRPIANTFRLWNHRLLVNSNEILIIYNISGEQWDCDRLKGWFLIIFTTHYYEKVKSSTSKNKIINRFQKRQRKKGGFQFDSIFLTCYLHRYYLLVALILMIIYFLIDKLVLVVWSNFILSKILQ